VELAGPAAPRPSLKPVGAKAKRQMSTLEKSRRATKLRADGRCEAVHRGVRCFASDDDWSHIFGRSNIVSEAMASSPQLTRRHCRPCHQKFHEGGDFPREQRWHVLHELSEEFDFPTYTLTTWQVEEWNPVHALREMLRQLQQEAA